MIIYEVRVKRIEDRQDKPGEVIGYLPERRDGLRLKDVKRYVETVFGPLIGRDHVLTIEASEDTLQLIAIWEDRHGTDKEPGEHVCLVHADLIREG
jgi:hypothetical protein